MSDIAFEREGPRPFGPTPSRRQLDYQAMGTIAFAHFGINTFTGREWGDGAEDPRLFDPPLLDADQWVEVPRAAGMGQLILTCKHHDGFCLWPSRLTRHSVAASPWRGGRGDLVREVSEACRRAGMRFGIYLSPWDRNSASYGRGAAYGAYYRGQLEELLTGYGEIGEVWFDGAKGPGADQDYELASWVELVRRAQPNAVVFSESGPDVRWVGNEEGRAGETNWSRYSPRAGAISGSDAALLASGDPDGSEWLVAECDVSIRPGWFYHREEDALVKDPRELAELFLASVGRNAVLLLNAPPGPEGLVAEPDAASLAAFGRFLRESFGRDLAEGSCASASSSFGPPWGPRMVLAEGRGSFWAAAEGAAGTAADGGDWIRLDFPEERSFDAVRIEEAVEIGQRIASFRVEALVPGDWRTLASGTTVGFKRILRFPAIRARGMRLRIDRSLAPPAISRFAAHLLAMPGSEGKGDGR